jgi:hypothetical protein
MSKMNFADVPISQFRLRAVGQSPVFQYSNSVVVAIGYYGEVGHSNYERSELSSILGQALTWDIIVSPLACFSGLVYGFASCQDPIFPYDFLSLIVRNPV